MGVTIMLDNLEFDVFEPNVATQYSKRVDRLFGQSGSKKRPRYWGVHAACKANTRKTLTLRRVGDF